MEALVLQQVSKRYGRVQALQEVSFSLPCGAFCGLFGRNGSGKSTLLNLVTGLVSRDSGEIQVLGEPLRLEPSVATKARFGFVAGHLELHRWMTCREHLDYVAACYPTWDAAHEQELLQILPVPLHQQVRTLSTGQYIQLQLVMALAHRPELLLIDEPGNLDPVVRQHLMEGLIAAVAEEHTTVLMASHLISELDGVCDHMCLIDRGRVVLSGPLEELRAQVKQVRYHGVPAQSPGRRRPLPLQEWADRGYRLLRDREGVRAVITGYTPERAAALGDYLGAESLELDHLALQELFVALTEDAPPDPLAGVPTAPPR